jgi:hypothetical protein
MFRTLANCLLQFFLFVFLQTNHSAFGQIASFPIEELVKKLAAKTDSLNMNFWNFTVKPGAEKNNNEANPLLEYDYRIRKKYHILDNEGYSLQRIARTNLLQGKKDSALLELKEALGLLKQKSRQPCLAMVTWVFEKRIKNIEKKIKTTAIYLQIKDQYGAGNISPPLSLYIKARSENNFIIKTICL